MKRIPPALELAVSRRHELICLPDVDFTKHRTSNRLPELLSILDRRDGIAASLAANGVARLGNPDRLSARGRPRFPQGILEQRRAQADCIGHRVLKVRIGVHADPIELVDDDAAGRIIPPGPRVDVSKESTLQRSAGNGAFDLLDVPDETSGSTPGLDPAAMPCGELRYRSSLPIEMPSTMLAKSSPYFWMAAFRAVISFAKAASPADAQRPSRSDVLVVMAAGMAEMGSLAVPPCYMPVRLG